jgi:hypothetical protein
MAPPSGGAKIDWAQRDLRNRQLGLEGEKLVVEYEVHELRQAGREDLANQVRHVALYDSAAGFDVASFFLDGRSKRIEVKTTEGPASAPFFISLNEVRAGREDVQSFVIYRVFEHKSGAKSVKFFELLGDPELNCSLVAVSFRAHPGASKEQGIEE